MKRNEKTIKTLTTFIIGLVLGTLVVNLTVGCNTAEGFGKDMEEAGEEIQEGTD
jgi:predicted small secreted protein